MRVGDSDQSRRLIARRELRNADHRAPPAQMVRDRATAIGRYVVRAIRAVACDAQSRRPSLLHGLCNGIAPSQSGDSDGNADWLTVINTALQSAREHGVKQETRQRALYGVSLAARREVRNVVIAAANVIEQRLAH
jgi:hypothetical protein